MPGSRTVPTPAEYQAYKDRFNNWGRWDAHDRYGTLNHITPEVRRHAAALVNAGRSISLANPLATAAVLPGARNTQPAEHRMNIGSGGCGDYIGVSYHGFVNTHIDALCHIFTEDGRLYGGRPSSDVTIDGARANAIDAWREGIVTRGVLYDVARHRGVYYVTAQEPVHWWELEHIAKAQGVEPQAGDAVLVRMGAPAFWAANPEFGPAWQAPGLHASALEFLFGHDAALLGWDLMEAPGQEEYRAHALPIHSIAIPYMGLPLLDNANFEELAVACSGAGRWEFMVTIAPLVVIGGTGSPVNPIALL
ncbi:MAG: cyclase family protein [Chloroflexi bacterium]|nr:cyclase family protein [Chloroflexota bacterium]